MIKWPEKGFKNYLCLIPVFWLYDSVFCCYIAVVTLKRLVVRVC